MRKGISRIYKYTQRNWTYPYSNTNFVITQCYNNSLQTQRDSASDTSVGAHDLESDGVYQSTNHHGHTNVKQGPAQDVPFFYTRSHFSELTSCKSIIPTDFSFISLFKYCTT